MEEDDTIKFAEVLSSKLCHDLISPVGALANGLEFLFEEGLDDNNTEFGELVQQSAKQAIERLAYFRVSIGAAGTHNRLKYEYLHELINKLAAEKGLDTNWIDFDDYKNSDTDKINGKLLLNLAMLSFDCLPSGGRAEIEIHQTKIIQSFSITVEGNPSILHNEISEVFSKSLFVGPYTARNILAVYSQQLAHMSDKKILAERIEENRIKFQLM